MDETGTYYTRNTNIVYWCMYVEFRKMVAVILYARKQKTHRCKEKTFGLSGRRWGWEDLREQHWNMYITIYKIDGKCEFDAWSRALKAGGSGTTQRDEVGREVGVGFRMGDTCGTMVDSCQCMATLPQYCKVSILQLKLILKMYPLWLIHLYTA